MRVQPSPFSAAFRRFICAALAACAGATMSLAQVAPPVAARVAVNEDNGPGLPFFDSRVDAQGIPLRSVTAHIDAARKLAKGDRRAIDIANLRTAIGALAIDEDPLFGTPRFVRSTTQLLTPPAQIKSPADLVRSFIAQHPALFEIDPREIDSARILRDYSTDHNGARHLTFQQQIKGADLFECEVRANITRNGELINIASTMLPRPQGDFTTPAPKFDDAAAIAIAAANVGITLSEPPKPASDPSGPSMKRAWAAHPDLRSDEPLVTELVFFPLDRDTIHPAWSVVVPVKGVGHIYDILVDASDGSILRRADRLVWDTTQPITLRVYTSDGVAPGSPGNATSASAFQFPVIPRTLLTVMPADMAPYSPNGWINDGNMETLGNNVDAHTDLNNDNAVTGADLPRPNGGPARVFDFPLDTTQDPLSYSQASVVELFYRANWYHDRLFSMGFNEAAGNFQTTNFSGQGVGNDAIQADCQDSYGLAATSSNRNNANFSTSGSDGSSGRVQMYIFPGPTPPRDGSLDGDIVYHELTHGTSTRLHHGLSGNQCQGMGEGWSDFFGICLLAEPADDPDAVYCTGGYTTYQLSSSSYTSNYYFGIRRFPYSTDLNKAPQTFADIDPGQMSFQASVPRSPIFSFSTTTANEVHNVGEIWCEMLMEGRASLMHQYGFPGNLRMLQLVIDAMKLSAANPTFIQARDAIIQADTVDYAGVDNVRLWAAFAKRGLGYSAVAPATTTTSGVVEAFDLPPRATFTYPDGLPSRLTPGAVTTFHVTVAGTSFGAPTPGTGQLFLSLSGGPYLATPLTQGAPNEYTITIPAQSCLTPVNFYLTVGTALGDQPDPTTAPSSSYHADVWNANTTTDGFETASGWTVGPDTATTGNWERATPQLTEAQPGAAHSGTFCFVTQAAAGSGVGSFDVDGGYTLLTSPAYDVSAAQDARISYWRWYCDGTSTSANPYTNTFRVDVSTNNGATWTNAETLGPGSASDPNTNPGWHFAAWKLSDFGLTPTATVKVRFTAEDATGSIVEAALDDFAIDLITCPPPASGACCTPAGSCSAAAPAACSGFYQGDNSVCSPSLCVPVSYSLTVTRTGSGHGEVNSPAAGIACGSACSATLVIGTGVTLSAVPAANSVFDGWTGSPCSGTGDCTFVISGPTTVTARFRCKGDFNADGVISVEDLFNFLAAWFGALPSADVNNSGSVTVQDIFDFLSSWFSPC